MARTWFPDPPEERGSQREPGSVSPWDQSLKGSRRPRPRAGRVYLRSHGDSVVFSAPGPWPCSPTTSGLTNGLCVLVWTLLEPVAGTRPLPPQSQSGLCIPKARPPRDSPSRGVCSGLLNPCLSHLPPVARGVCAGWWSGDRGPPLWLEGQTNWSEIAREGWLQGPSIAMAALSLNR